MELTNRKCVDCGVTFFTATQESLRCPYCKKRAPKEEATAPEPEPYVFSEQELVKLRFAKWLVQQGRVSDR